MGFVNKSLEGPVAKLTLSRGKVNAINELVAEELRENFKNILNDKAIKAVLITGGSGFLLIWVGYPRVPQLFKGRFHPFCGKIRRIVHLYFHISQTGNRRVERAHDRWGLHVGNCL